jgi:hypothetical protein
MEINHHRFMLQNYPLRAWLVKSPGSVLHSESCICAVTDVWTFIRHKLKTDRLKFITHLDYVMIINVLGNLDHGESMVRYLGKLEYYSTWSTGKHYKTVDII